MLEKARLYYDANCPICNNYIKLLQRKINPNILEFLPISSDSKDFQFVSMDGRVSIGSEAIEKLAAAFPAVKNYFWMLPEKYKVPALKTAYKVGSAVRNAIKKVARKVGGCNCGKKKNR
jgi:predicted DCC family thiol-disulfide oxidoreductase YuxK